MVTVTAFDAGFLIEARAATDQVVDLPRRFAHHHFDDGAIAQPRSRRQGVFDVVLEAIFRRAHGSDAALSIIAIALSQAVLGDDEGA
jgi:hypothetical protein